MAKIKWKSQVETENEILQEEKKINDKEKHKGKDFNALSRKEKDELLERIARDLGYL